MAEVIVLNCTRCGHQWARRGEQDPKVCPNCKNTRWNWPADLDTRWSCERIVAELRELDAAGVEMSSVHLREHHGRLYGAIYYHFGSIDAAMNAAGVIKVRHIGDGEKKEKV